MLRILCARTPESSLGRSVPRTFELLCADAVRAAESRALKIHHITRRRTDLVRRLAALKAEGLPRICFGSRKLFNAQHHLRENGFDSHDDWLAMWQAQRNSQFLVLGSKDESDGCQGCVMTHQGANQLALKLRLDGQASAISRSRYRSHSGSITCSLRSKRAKRCRTVFSWMTRAGAFLSRPP